MTRKKYVPLRSSEGANRNFSTISRTKDPFISTKQIEAVKSDFQERRSRFRDYMFFLMHELMSWLSVDGDQRSLIATQIFKALQHDGDAIGIFKLLRQMYHVEGVHSPIFQKYKFLRMFICSGETATGFILRREGTFSRILKLKVKNNEGDLIDSLFLGIGNTPGLVDFLTQYYMDVVTVHASHDELKKPLNFFF